MPQLHVVGDIHGHLAELRRLLRAGSIVDERDEWLAAQDTLVFVGDMVDRGSDGIGIIELVMHLQAAARRHGGAVHAVLGNHEVQFLAAHRLGNAPRGADVAHTFFGDWHRWGGVLTDLERLQPQHLSWLLALPTMVRVGDALLVHADATFYPEYGRTIDDVNAKVTAVLESDEPGRWDQLQRDMVGKHAFEGDSGGRFLERVLEQFGARRLIHGHSPICNVTGQPAHQVAAPLVYAGGRCVNVDHGVYLGGAGFLFSSTIHSMGGVLSA